MTKEKSNMYVRQYGFFNPAEQKVNVHIFGAGSIGSFLTLNLAKLGFEDISIYDFDSIEEHNLPNQFYRVSDIGKPKVDALKEIVKDFSGIDITAHNNKITPKNAPDITEKINIDSLIVLAFDNLEARKMVYESVKGYPNKLLDVRMGGKGWEMFIIDLDDEDQCKVYEASLENDTMDLPCGQQSIIFTLLNIASEISSIIVKINNGEEYVSRLRRHMDSYLFIHSGNEEEEEEEEEESEEIETEPTENEQEH